MSASLGLQPRLLMSARVHQVLDAHALAIAISTSDMNKNKPCVTLNKYSPACHLYDSLHKAHTKAHALSKPASFHHGREPPNKY